MQTLKKIPKTNFDIFSNLCGNADAVVMSTRNQYFGSEIRIKMFTHVNPSFALRGYAIYGYVILMISARAHAETRFTRTEDN